MSFANPAYLSFGFLIPVLIALYFRKNRPIRRVLPSNRLWEIVSRRLEQNSLFQKYRHSIFLILQLIALMALILGMARPFWKNSLAGRMILFMDTSASMRSTDVAPDRFSRAKEKALSILTRLDSSAQVALLTGDSSVTLRAAFGTDTAAVTAMVRDLTPTDHPGPAQDEAVSAIESLLHQGPSRVCVLTDQLSAAELAAALPDVSLEVYSFGERSENVAVGRVDVRPTGGPAPSGKGIHKPNRWDVEVQLLSFAPGPLTVQLTISQNGHNLATRSAGIGGKSDLVMHFENLAISEGVVNVEASVPSGDDFLDADNRAWAIVGRQDFSVLLIGSKTGALARVIRSIPGARVEVIASMDAGRGATLPPADITVVESGVHQDLSDRNALIFCSADDSGFEAVQIAGRAAESPVPTRYEATHPLLKYLSLKDVNFGPTAVLRRITGDVEVLGAAEGPLILARSQPGVRQVICAFTPNSSNISLRVGFPIFVVNCLRWVGGERLAGVTRVNLGDSYRVPTTIEPPFELLGPNGIPVPIPVAAPVPTSPGLLVPSAAPSAPKPTSSARLIPASCFSRAGLYTISAGTKRWTVPATLSSFSESNIVPAQTQPFVREIKRQNDAAAPQGMARYLLILALLVLIAEGALYARIGG